MRSTRDMYDALKVEPTKALLVCPMPCEGLAADKRNEAVSYMEHDDVPGVAMAYLENRFMEKWADAEIFIPALIAVNSIYQFVVDRNPGAILGLLIAGAYMLPNIFNTIRYHETKNACEKWLASRISAENMDDIEKLYYNKRGLFALSDILQEEGISTEQLKFDAKDGTLADAFACCLGRGK